MINIELYNVYGSPGSPTLEVMDSNFWKNISADEATYPYYMYPLRRPYAPNATLYDDMYVCSYLRYTRGVISGTYTKAKRARWTISGAAGLNTKLYYKMTSTYANPNNLLMSGTLINSSATLWPMLSTVSPEYADSIIMNLTPNTTYYTNYLITQLYVRAGTETEVGNIPEINIQLLVDDYE